MKIILHGTGAGHPSAERGASAASVIFNNGEILLLDAGEGCSRAMLRDGILLNNIFAVAISHTHADHWTGFPNLVMGWTLGQRSTPVDIYLPPNTAEFFQNVLQASYLLPERRSFQIRYHDIASVSLPDGWTLRPFRTAHLNKYQTQAEFLGLAFPSFGYILEKEGRKIVFSQDLASESDLIPELLGAELVICELSHINPTRFLQLARKNGVARVIFTHVPPKLPAMPGQTEGVDWSIAEDGNVIEL